MSQMTVTCGSVTLNPNLFPKEASVLGIPTFEALVPLTEDALRRLYDFLYLSEHPFNNFSIVKRQIKLAAPTTITFLERAKALNRVLVQTFEHLAPYGAEPNRERIPPREWHCFLILRDSYVRCEANRSIMCRLQISEGTFHRTRRRALRMLAQAL